MPPPARSNQYFVPRDGIDREVISADICRYLGNDALVRPGTYEDPNTHQVQQGYYITAYRNLTTAMIDDLKADSARWDNERRLARSEQASAGTSYNQSDVHSQRQRHGPTETSPQEAYNPPYGDHPSYSGNTGPGYTGGGYQQPVQQTTAPVYTGAPYGGVYPNQQQPSGSDPRFGHTQSPSMNQSYQSPGAPRGYGSPTDPYSSRMPPSSAASMAPLYTSAPPQSGYPASYYGPSSSGNDQYQGMMQDYGRVSPGSAAQPPPPQSGHSTDRYNNRPPPRR